VSETSFPSYHFASDDDAVRHLIIDDPAVDCTGWRVIEKLSWRERYECEFHRRRVWGDGPHTNFLGIGDAREAWAAIVDWDATSAQIVTPGGTRLEVRGIVRGD
jgi:hypothetical protein